MRPEFDSFEKWAHHMGESGHSPEDLRLRSVVVEMKQKHPDVKELARLLWGKYRIDNPNYDDIVDEHGNLTPEGIEMAYKEAARRELIAEARSFKNSVGRVESKNDKTRPRVEILKKSDRQASITDLISKHGLRKYTNITAIDKSGRVRRYRVDFVHTSGGNQRLEVVRSFEGTPAEVDEFLSNAELRKELDKQLGL